MTEVRDAIADILDSMTLEQFVAKDGKVDDDGHDEEKAPVSAAS
jgi:DNA-binding IscR family transcriptional regulator